MDAGNTNTYIRNSKTNYSNLQHSNLVLHDPCLSTLHKMRIPRLAINRTTTPLLRYSQTTEENKNYNLEKIFKIWWAILNSVSHEKHYLNLFRGDTYMTSTLRGKEELRQIWDVIRRRGRRFSECSGRPILFYYN